MKSCASVQKKGSINQCSNKCLKNHTLCGIHARSKHILLWTDANRENASKLVKCQSLIRGWLLRNRLKLGGPGVLVRGNVMNTDDLETCTESTKEHPFTYFGFEENGKIWWFHFPTLWKWSVCSMHPTNPYTKVPLTLETRNRLREMWAYNWKYGVVLPEESDIPLQRLIGKWTVMSQLFSDNAFGDINPKSFVEILTSKSQFIIIFRMIHREIGLVIKNPEKIIKLCNIGIETSRTLSVERYLNYASHLLMLILTSSKNTYPITFVVLSALYRV